MTVTKDDVRQYCNQRVLTIPTEADPSLLDTTAKAITIALTGKNKKQDREATKRFLAEIRFEQDPTAGSDSLHQAIEAENDASADEHQDDTTDEASSLAEQEAEIDASRETEDGEGEPKASSSVVKSKYRQEYKARGDARGNNDWLQQLLKVVCNGGEWNETRKRVKDGKLDLALFQQVVDANDGNIDKFTTAEKRTTNGWQGRARMSGGIELRNLTADRMELLIPVELWNRDPDSCEAVLAELNLGGELNIEDDLVSIRPNDSWVGDVFSRRANPENKKGKKKSK